jgi:hypothetical protein
MTAVPTSVCPQAGHRSGWASPRWAHTVCQASHTGSTTGGCPSAVRLSARAAVCVGWYSPDARTPRLCGLGTGCSHRWRKAATAKVIRCGEALRPAASSQRARGRQVTRAPSQATRRAFVSGPPRSACARDVPPRPRGESAPGSAPGHGVFVGGPKRCRRWPNCCGRIGAGRANAPRAPGGRIAARPGAAHRPSPDRARAAAAPGADSREAGRRGGRAARPSTAGPPARCPACPAWAATVGGASPGQWPATAG